MKTELVRQIEQLNPSLINKAESLIDQKDYIPRKQSEKLLSSAWDKLWLILTGPRQAGKTTLGKYLCQELLAKKRFEALLYLNCDYLLIREWLNNNPGFVHQALAYFHLQHPIIFIDEVQRLENAGLLLKAIVDLKLPIKMLASGSSQLEIKSKVQEYLTGRHLEALVLPLSYAEIQKDHLENRLLFGCYPNVIKNPADQGLLLSQLFKDYIHKDIIEILRVNHPDILQKLLVLLAHSSGQLVNYTQLSNDCRASVTLVSHYLSLLEKTYVIAPLLPFCGNKRSEITSNPIYYFLDNGFRNQALQNFSSLESRTDKGLLIQSAVFQEIFKYKYQHFCDFAIYFWRTTNGAEVDFVLNFGSDSLSGQPRLLPIEVKYRSLSQPKVTRAFRSFLQAYQPSQGIFVTKDFIGEARIENCHVHFVPFEQLPEIFPIIQHYVSYGG